jgi:uncharacterized protein (TIRG00374 family)
MRHIKKLLTVLLASLIILGVVVHVVGFEPTCRAVAQAGLLAFLAVGLLTLIFLTAQTAAWAALNRGIGHRIPFLTLMKAMCVGFAGNELTPLHIGGEPVKVVYVGRMTGLSYREIAGTVLLFKYLEALSFVVFLSLGAAVGIIGFKDILFHQDNVALAIWILAGVLLVLAACIALWISLSQRWTPLTACVTLALRLHIFRRFLARLRNRTRKTEEQCSRVFREEGRAVIPAFCCHIIAHAALLMKPAVFFYLGWRAQLSAPELGLLYLVYQLLLVVQITPSSVGTLDGGLLGVVALAQLSLSPPQCAAFLLCLRMWDAIIIPAGVIFASRTGADFFEDLWKSESKMHLLTRIRLLLGRPRRLFLHIFRPQYVRKQHALRKGECLRCGACCRMGIRCPDLSFDDKGTSLCKRYQRRRPPNCRNFPIDERDLADRDLVSPDKPCGFTFEQ